MNGTRRIIEGDNAVVHAYFTERSQLELCHCDACSTARSKAYWEKSHAAARAERIWEKTVFCSILAFPVTLALIICAAASSDAGGWFYLALGVLVAEIAVFLDLKKKFSS